MRVRLIPQDGRRIMYPAGSTKQRRCLPPEGEEVNLDSYWHARLAEGSVKIEEPTAPAKAPKGKG